MNFVLIFLDSIYENQFASLVKKKNNLLIYMFFGRAIRKLRIMVNITHKSSTLRIAIATGIVKVSKQETIDAIRNRTVPKGDVFEFSRAAGLLACKKTYEVIPDCHPLPIEYTSITHEINGLEIVEAAKEVCSQCEVRKECLQFSFDTNQESGIWGGYSETERRLLKKSELPQYA